MNKWALSFASVQMKFQIVHINKNNKTKPTFNLRCPIDNNKWHTYKQGACTTKQKPTPSKYHSQLL
jgi:flagellar assembly factor FliW